jgi:hypothetical protein
MLEFRADDNPWRPRLSRQDEMVLFTVAFLSLGSR